MSAAVDIYLLLASVSAPVYRLVLRRRLAAGKEDAARAGERFGHAGLPRPEGRLVWFHAASVGESASLQPVIAQLLEDRPALHVLVTTQTVTAAAILARSLPERAMHQFFPYDIPHVARRFLDHWRPDVAVWTESELWPAMQRETARRDIPNLLINARISERTARRWRAWPRTVRRLFSRFAHVFVQEAPLRDLLVALGVDAGRVTVTGGTKGDVAPLPAKAETVARLDQAMGARPRWLAASTHPGEEQTVLAAHRALGPQALLVIAPRHPDRGGAVRDLAEAAGFRVALRSEDQGPEGCDVYIADTVGEMGLWYRLCPVALVGGSLVPVGGHNPFEPIALDCVVLHGPHVGNFAETYARLAGATQAVETADALGQALATLQDPQARDALLSQARRLVSGDQAATRHLAHAIIAALPAPADKSPGL